MKTLLSLLMAAVALVAAHPDYSDTWEEFKQTYSKQYESEDEEVRPDTLLVSGPDGDNLAWETAGGVRHNSDILCPIKIYSTAEPGLLPACLSLFLFRA